MFRAKPRKFGALGEEAVARMKRIAAARLGSLHHQPRVEIAFRRRAWPQHQLAIRQTCSSPVAVRIGNSDHRFKIQRLRGAQHPEGDFPAIGNEQA